MEGPLLLLDGLAQPRREREARHRVGVVRRVHDVATRAGLLAAEHRGVGVLQQLDRVVGVEREHADPEAGGQVQLGVADPERLLQRLLGADGDRFGHDRGAVLAARHRRRPVDVGEQQQELVSAGAADEVGLARRVPQPFRELPDQGVAGLVPERVVHELEVVQVHRDHGDPEVGAPGAREGEPEQLVEHRAVRQARELVVVREVGDLLLRGLALGDVEHHALDQLRAPLRVGEHDRRVTEPHDAPVAPHEAVLEDERLTGLPAAEVGRDGLVPVLGVEQVRPQVGVVDVLLGADAEEFPDLRAHVGRAHLRVGEVDVDDRRDLLHERPVLRLGLLELAARERQLRDVEHQPEPVPRRAVVPGDQDRVLADPPEPAVAMERAVLDVERLTLGGRPLALGDDTFEIVGMDGRLPTPESACAIRPG